MRNEMAEVTTEEKKEQANRRQEILDAAATIFAEKGYEATSIQDVAEAVDILKGSLYYYIDSKEDLLFGVIQDVHEPALANLAVQRSSEGPALDRLRKFVTEHVMYNARNLTKMAVFFHDFRSLTGERRETIVRERDLYDLYLRELIAQGQKEGTICPGIDKKLAAFAIFGLMNWMYHWYRSEGQRSPEQIAEAFAEMAVRSVACPGVEHPGHRKG
jgi:AcrR family transcriptional regulator